MTELAKKMLPLHVRGASWLRTWFIGLGLSILRLTIMASCRVAPGAMARVFERALTSPRRYRANARERALLGRADHFRIQTGQRDLAVWRWGNENDPVVVMMHGWEGRGGQLAALAQPLVENGYQVITFDAPAHGDSGGRRVSVFDFADSLLAVGREVGEVRAIIAHSFGCTASTFAIATGLNPERVVYFAPQFSLAKGTLYYTRLWGVSFDVLERVRVSMEKRYGVQWEDIEMESMAPDMRAKLLIVHDELDRQVKHTNADELAAAWPNAQVVKTEGLGHQRILRDHAAVSAAVQFLSN